MEACLTYNSVYANIYFYIYRVSGYKTPTFCEQVSGPDFKPVVLLTAGQYGMFDPVFEIVKYLELGIVIDCFQSMLNGINVVVIFVVTLLLVADLCRASALLCVLMYVCVYFLNCVE